MSLPWHCVIPFQCTFQAWMALFHSHVSSHSIQSRLLSNVPEWRNLFISRHLQLCSWLDWEHLQWRFVECIEAIVLLCTLNAGIVIVLSSRIQTVHTHTVTSENGAPCRTLHNHANWWPPFLPPFLAYFWFISVILHVMCNIFTYSCLFLCSPMLPLLSLYGKYHY